MTDIRRNLLDQALRSSVRPLGYAFLFSFCINILYLALPLYMVQLYGRVFASQSIATLLIMAFSVTGAFIVSAVLDHYRSSVLIHFGVLFDRLLAQHVFGALFSGELKENTGQSQAVRDLDVFRQTLTGSGMAVFFDLPWMPIFMGALFIIDPWVGLLCLVGGFILLGLAVLQDRVSRRAITRVNSAAIRGYQFTDMALRNAEVVRALGMLPALTKRWQVDRLTLINGQAHASEQAGKIGELIKFTRMLIQIMVLALGAFLVLKQVIGPGVLFANMILSSKALAPFERVAGSWQSLVEAGQIYKRLGKLMDGYEPNPVATAMPRPNGLIEVQNVTFQLPTMKEPVLKNITFSLKAGEALGIIGPSGAGKSTLTRMLIGIWKPTEGHVRLDGMEVHAWDRAAFGRHVGYLPQDTELFTGTVRDNIARFRTDVSDEAVTRAAQDAGIHDLIVRLEKGYESELGASGTTVFSVGQRQRLGLARALLGDPSLVVLDEPNANLDTEGEAALLDVLGALKARGVTVVIVSHRASVFRHVDKILFVRGGEVQSFGDRDVILGQLMQPAGVPGTAETRAAPPPAVAQG
ncbi:type I secretion system permease/ATPase [Methylobacterium sp. Leaf112]|uniref:type I secretion system permease/ATPase n=1 Tax=Methylobacterium sp. Leaf112 TaxID=1736258 RepID=UPI0006FB52FC|nr:type I secretion system permease/ATPase [Methylobacterium sp. Leaf112]KQP59467.1 ABC transporter ATP-binding protein [Methylobacterium sp. Leaf112]